MNFGRGLGSARNGPRETQWGELTRITSGFHLSSIRRARSRSTVSCPPRPRTVGSIMLGALGEKTPPRSWPWREGSAGTALAVLGGRGAGRLPLERIELFPDGDPDRGLEEVTRLHSLRFQVPLVVRVGGDLERDPSLHFGAVVLEVGDLRRIVREEQDRLDPEGVQHVGSDGVVPLVGPEPEGLVRLDGVQPELL